MKKFLSLVLALGLSISVLSVAVFAEDAPAEAQAEGSVSASTLEPAEMTGWPLHHVDVRIPGMVEVRYVDENGNVQSTEQVQVGVHAVSMKKNGWDMGPFYPKAGLPEQQKEFEWRNDELCLSVDDDLSITCKVFGTLADGTVFEREHTHTFTAEEKEAARLACPGCDTILAGLDFDIAMSFDETITPTPTTEPTAAPTTEPTTEPTAAPTTEPTTAPTTEPTAAPTAAPTNEPTTAPTTAPTNTPTQKPSSDKGDKSEKKVEAAPAATAVPVKASPKTADTAPLALYGAAAVLCAAALVVARRRANH